MPHARAPSRRGRRNGPIHFKLRFVSNTMSSVASQYPRKISLPDGQSVQLRLMTPADRNAMLAFARSLPQEDLLFLRVDISDPAAVDIWIRNIEAGLSATLLAFD